MKWTLVFYFFGIFFTSAQGELAFRNYSLESGLPSNTVYETFQDEKGYIYVGHNNGVSVFNGLSFQSPSCSDNSSALSNFISFSNGQLMCRNFQGKQYILRDNKLIRFQSSLKESWGFPTYLQDGDKHYVFQSGSFYTLSEDGSGKRIDLPIENIHRIFHGVVMSDTAYLFLNSENGTFLICVDLIKRELISKRQFDSNQNAIVYKGKDRVVWLEERTGSLGVFEKEFVDRVKLYPSVLPLESKITGYLDLPDGTILISTFNGVFRLNDQWELQHHYLKGIQCTNLMLDNRGGLWVSSIQNGVFHVPNIDFLEINAASFDGPNVKFSKLTTHKGFLYLGTYDGRIFKINEKGELVNVFDFERDVEIQSLCIVDNIMYAYCGGLLTVDLEKGAKIHERPVQACKSISAHNDGLVCGSSKGLLFIQGDELSVYLDTLWIKNVIPISFNNYLLECTENVYVFQRQTKALNLIQMGGKNSCQIGNNWFYRTSHSVYQINDELVVKKIYSSQIEIAHLSSTDHQLTIDLTNNQSYQLVGPDFKTKKTLSNCFLEGVTLFGELSNYRIKGNNNSLHLIPKYKTYKSIAPKLYLTKKTGNFSMNKETYILPYNDNTLLLEFDVLPNYLITGESTFYYRIAELSNHWRKALKSDRYAVELLRIPPGEYTLEVYAESDGALSATSYFALQVEQPFYFQWWFVMLASLLMIGLIYSIGVWRERLSEVKNQRILKEQELKMKALNSELVAIRSQMNPHFIFNSLSSIQTKILNEDRVEAYKNVSTFATLLRQALQFTSKEFISLQEELAFTRNYISLEQTRTANAFTYLEEIDENLDLRKTDIPALFLQPFIENAIRHGLIHSKNNKVLRLTIVQLIDGFEATIEDNGIGRIASAAINEQQRPEHTSFATRAIEDRIDILRDSKKMFIELNVEDLNSGVRVTIKFKLK